MEGLLKLESRKLIAFVLALSSLVLLFGVGALAIAFLGTPWEFLASIGATITTALGIHNGAQAAADRSQFYTSTLTTLQPSPPYAAPPAPSSATPPWTPPPGTGASV